MGWQSRARVKNYAAMDYQIVPRSGSEQVMAEILGATRRPDGYAMTLMDMERAEEFRARRASETCVPLTLIDLWVKALALTFGKDEKMNGGVQGGKRFIFPQADIGVSVASTTSIAPVVVVPDAFNKSLEEIHHERIALAAKAREEDGRRRAELESLFKVFRWSPVRRKLVDWRMNQPIFKRQYLGTLQISTIDLPDMEFYMPCHVGTALLVSVGGVKKRPMVVGDEVVPRLSAYCAYMIDQRLVHPVQGVRVIRRFQRLLQNPEKLVGSPGAAAVDD